MVSAVKTAKFFSLCLKVPNQGQVDIEAQDPTGMSGKGGTGPGGAGTGTSPVAAAAGADPIPDTGAQSGGAGGGGAGPGGSAGRGPSTRSSTSSSGGGRGQPRTSTPAKTKGKAARRSSLTPTSDLLIKEQQMLDKAEKDKNKKKGVPSETQTKIAEYLRKVKEGKKEEQDYRKSRTAATPAAPEGGRPGTSEAPAASTRGSTFKEVLQEAADATKAARAATAKGLPAMTMVAKQVAKVMQAAQKRTSATILGLSWAEEVDQDRMKQSRVILGTEADKEAKAALAKQNEARRYRTCSSSSSTSVARTGTGTEDEEFTLVDRRRKSRRQGQRTTDRDRYRIPRIQILLTEQQKLWYQDNLCLNCGGRHMVHNCRDRKFDKEKASALLRAARKAFPDGPTKNKAQGVGAKRPTSERTGVTPEAKRGKAATATATATEGASAAPRPTSAPIQTKPWFKPMQQTEHTLFIKNKDGSPLSEARFNEIKAVYDKIRLRIGKANMQAKTKEELQFTPRCSGWNWSPEVARITLKDLDSFRWARTTFGEFQLMDLAQWKASRGRLYCAYLTDRFDPSVTEMGEEDLIVAVWQAKMDLKIAPGDLFQFVRAPRVTRGRLIFISVGEQGEEALRSAGFRIELGSAGDVLLTDNEKFLRYKKEKKAQEQEYRRQKEAADAEEEEVEEYDQDQEVTLTNEASVLVLEEKGEKEKNPPAPTVAEGDKGKEQKQAVAMEEDDDLDAMEAFLREERLIEEKEEEGKEKGSAEPMETEGLDEPMQS